MASYNDIEELYQNRKYSSPFLELLFKSGLFLLFLYSLNIWVLWQFNPITIPIICTIMCLPYFMQVVSLGDLLSVKFWLPVSILLIAKILSIGDTNLNGYIGSLFSILPVIFVVPLSSKIKLKALDFFTNGIAIILVPALIIWILLLSGIGLPSLGRISNPVWEYYTYDNYFFCLRSPLLYARRFNGVFLEPGHLGMIASFLLFANKFDIKRKAVIVLIVAVIFTLSLAAFVLSIVAFAFYIALYSKRSLSYFGGTLLVLICGYFFFANYNGGDNVINERIISRLKYDDSQGDIAGNNRFTKKLTLYYKSFINSDDSWYGIGSDRFTGMHFGPSAGYEVFVVQNGLVGTFLIFFFYLSLVLLNKSKFAMALMAIYILAFLQRAYPFWACELLIFITVLPLGLIKNDETKT